MSRLWLLGSATPTANGGGGGGGGNPDPPPAAGLAWPTTTDTVLLGLRPHISPQGVYGVAPVGTVGRTHEWIYYGADGTTEATGANALNAARQTAALTGYGASGPRDGRTVLLAPNNAWTAGHVNRTHYQGGLGLPGVHLVGTGATPADTVLFSDNTNADGVTHTYGAHLENLTLKSGWSGADGSRVAPKYGSHIAAGNTVFANVIFDNTDVDTSLTYLHPTSGLAGMDGAPGTFVVFYKCDFRRPATETGTNPPFNLHGASPGLEPITVCFIDCIAPNGISFGGPGTTDGRPDRMYVVGGTVGNKIVANATTHVYTDSAITVEGGGPVTRNTTTWPAPANGLGGMWADYYTPSIIGTPGTTVVKATVTDAAPMAVTPGRIYYCPVPITSAMHANRHGLTVVNPAGSWALRPNPDSPVTYGSPFSANTPPVADMPLGADSAVPGAGQYLGAFYYSWVIYPGRSVTGTTSVTGTRAWVAARFTSGSCTVTGSAELPGLHDCYYSDDGGCITLVKATAGTPFPLAHVAQVT